MTRIFGNSGFIMCLILTGAALGTITGELPVPLFIVVAVLAVWLLGSSDTIDFHDLTDEDTAPSAD